jgi:beta-glucosidase
MMDYDITKGRTYMYSKAEPLYEFGFGLSYSTFEYSNLKIDKAALSKDGEISISVDVKNTGKYNGDEVVQLYINFKSKLCKCRIEGFKRISINKGQTKTVDIILKLRFTLG